MNSHRGIRLSSVLALTCGAIALGALFGGCIAPDDSADSPPRPPGTGTAIVQPTFTSPPDQTPPSYVHSLKVDGPAILHWEQMSYVKQEHPADKFQGEQVFGDIWLELDSSGAPVKYEATYTLRDGTPVQQIYQDDTSTSVRMNQSAAVPPGVTPEACRTSSDATRSGDMAALMPTVIDPSALEVLGYSATQAKAVELPPSSVPGVQPVAVVPADHFVTLQLTDKSPDGNQQVTQTSIEPTTHRVVGTDYTRLGPDGAVISEQWTRSGPIEVLNTDDVPAGVFHPVTTEGC